MKKKAVLLTFDPGKLNFAYSMLTPKGDIIRTGMLTTTLTNLKEPDIFTYELKMFKDEVKSLCDKDTKLRVVFERFVPRGSRYMGNLIEITCLKIGILTSTLSEYYDNVKFTPILASSWKNFYKKYKISLYENDSAPEHILDSIHIGLYYLVQSQRLEIIELKHLTKAIRCVNFNWYNYKSNWYFGERKSEHLRGRRNSFGN